MKQPRQPERAPDEPGPPTKEAEALRDNSPGAMQRRMGIAALMLSASILLSRILGFLRDVLVTSWYQAGVESDAYYAAFKLPDMMNYFLAGGTLSITFIPIFSAYLARDEEEAGWRLFSTVATVMGVALAIASLGAMLGAPWIIPRLFPGFTSEAQLALTISMTRIVIPAQLAFYVGGLIQATLFSREVFWPSALSPLVYNGMIILGGWALAPWLGIEGFAVGVLLGAVLGPLALPLWAARRHVRYTPRFDVRSEGFKTFVKLTLPLMFGATLVTVDEWLLAIFGSLHEEGSITLLNHSRKLMMVCFAVIGQAAGQAALPYMSKLAAVDDDRALGELISGSLQRVVFLSIFAAAGLAALSEPLVHVLYRHGAFTAQDAKLTAELLVWFCLGLTSWTAQAVAVRGFYARQDTMTPMVVGTVVLLLSLPVYWALDRALGVRGLAMATTVGITLNVVAIVVAYRVRGGELPLGGVLSATWRAGLGAALSAGAALLGGAAVEPLLDSSSALSGLVRALCKGSVMGGAFGLVALLYAVVVKPPELEALAQRVRRKLLRGRGERQT